MYLKQFYLVVFLSLISSHLSAVEPLASQEVRHEPVSPKPGVPVLVTAVFKAGISNVKIKLQSIAPGKYVRKSDPTYEKDWAELPMHDDGKDGDAKAGDGIFSIRIPSSYQQNRWLIRYRIIATDEKGQGFVLPAAGDSCPNFAWWCDAGPATWIGTRQPGKTLPLTFSSEFLNTLQSVHLVARADDVASSQWDGNAHKQKKLGTLVYRGIVYDHIQFSNRGQGSAHISGKNKWGLKFNTGHDVPFVDHDGKPFPAECGSINLNPGGSTPYLPILRGVTGLDEVLSMRAYLLAGVPSPASTWIQWRVVTGAEEVSLKNQYEGDLWGVYVAMGDMKPKMLAEHKLPDGLTVSIQSGIKHTPKEMVDAGKVWEKFINELRSNPKEDWCRKNLDLKAYYSFHAMNRLLANVDLRPDGNHGYYRHPDGHWSPIPWDNDMIFVPRHHQPGHIDAMVCLNHPNIALEYRNRAREILDLFAGDASEKGGQVGQMAFDLSSALTPKGYAVDWPRLDEAVWNQHPRSNQKDSFLVNPANADHFGGPWKRTIATNDFEGFRKYIIDFCTDSRPNRKYAPNDGDQRGYGWGYLAHEAMDDKIPAKPTVTKDLAMPQRFTASKFLSPVNHQQAALEWRVGRVGQKGWYELSDYWRMDVEASTDVNIPKEVLGKSGDFRVRARWRDSTGRCSHWSDPILIVVP